jgi:phage tail P2-like protein
VTLLPPNATQLERGMEAAMARLADVPVPIRPLYDPDTCPVELLPYLAWALSIDTWSTDWPETVKRARVRSAIAIQRRKGTARSVRDVIQSFGGEVAIREWWEMQPLADPHTFTLLLDLNGRSGGIATAAYVDQVVAEVTRTKPVRSHFIFSQALNAVAGIVPVAAARPAIFTRLSLRAPAA